MQATGQFVEIIPALTGVFQTRVIQHEALDDIFLELLVGPLAKTHAYRAAHAKAEGEDHIEIVVCYHILFAVCGSCSEKPNN